MRRVAVVINGYPRSGKDTACQYVIQRLADLGWRGHSISSVDPVREMLRSVGVPVDTKTPEVRDLMAEVQSALNRYHWLPTRLCADKVCEWLNRGGQPALCLVHIREAVVIDRFLSLIKDTGVETATLLVDRREARGSFTNVADSFVENYGYDWIIDNNGSLEDLKAACIRFADMITEASTKHDDDLG